MSDVLTVRQAAEQLGVCYMTAARLFENERGVIVLTRPEEMHKRKYRSLRIPRVVFERVLGKLANK